MNILYGWLFGRVLRLDMSGDGPPWPLSVHNPTSGEYELVNGLAGVGSGGSPLLAPGLDVEPVVELLVLAGDPPDALTMAGDFLYLRQWTPTFLGTADGDIVVT